MERAKQMQAILSHLRTVGPITPLDALNRYGCMRLGARIFDLKKQGVLVSKELVSRNGKRFAEYRLESGPEAAA